MNKLLLSNKFFYLLFLLVIVTIFFSSPFLRVPYDMWFHIDKINYYTIHYFPIWEIKNKELWHYLWGSLFTLLHIDDLFIRTNTIHITQSVISFFIIYFTSNVIIRNLFKTIEPLALKYLSLWSVLIWFTIYATFSVAYHQVWILWYSINYQITLLLFWYVIALLFIIVLEKQSKFTTLLYLFQIFFFSIIILWMHAIEFIYICMYLVLFSIIYIREIFNFLKNYYIQSLLFIILTVGSFYYFITNNYIYKKPPLFRYLDPEHIHELYPKLLSFGHHVVNNLSRASASLNELMYLSIFLLLIMSMGILYNNYTIKVKPINLKIFILIFISSLFIFIPINVISAGVASLLIAPVYINRFYYTSSIFIILPIVVYYFFYRKHIWLINAIILGLILTTIFYSKYLSPTNNYYQNIYSITESFRKDKITFNLSQDEIRTIDEKIKAYELLNTTNKHNYYYARDDIALTLKLIYNKPVLWSQRGNKDFTESYHSHNDDNFNPILFKTPKGFPKYERYK